MIPFVVEKGNHKQGYINLGVMDANTMFEMVYDIMRTNNLVDKIVRQWQEAEYTYIDYGSHTNFLRYKAAIIENSKEKEDQ
jgi:hypothetical protein